MMFCSRTVSIHIHTSMSSIRHGAMRVLFARAYWAGCSADRATTLYAGRRLERGFRRCDPFIHLYRARLRHTAAKCIGDNQALGKLDFTNARNAAVFGRQAELCQIGVDTHDFRPLETRLRKDFVLSVGEMSPRKGFDFVVDSWERYRQERDRF
jgi:glycosyltransferase involved in cell wall biosynthesis